MKGIQVRWPRRPWNRASPSNPATRKYSIEMVVDMHTQVRRRGLPLAVRERMWIQHDGAPPHFSVDVRNYLNASFPDRCIWRGGAIPWPARSPDLIPFIIFMGISKFTCVWDPSRNGHGISYQNCSCLWYYSKHIRDICQGATESCHVCIEVGDVNLSNCCKMQNDTLIVSMYVLYLQVTVTNVNKKWTVMW